MFDGEALDYRRLEDPWREWAWVARGFSLQVDNPWDKEDLMHDIILRLAEVARKYQDKGKPLTRGGTILVAQHTRSRFYHERKRWARVSQVSLNSPVENEDGYETEIIDTLADDKAIDLDTWLDAKTHYLSTLERTRQTVRKRLNGAELSGWEWKLLKRFRDGFRRS